MQDESLTIPLVFESKGQIPDLERACSSAVTTRLVTWGFGGWLQGYSGDPMAGGAAIGCEDGSVYIFALADKKKGLTFPISDMSSRPSSLPHSRRDSRAPSPPQPPSPTLSQKFPTRNVSGPSHISQFLSQSTRARTTSAVSKTSAEAPKNYVDFEEEKEKLEEIVKNGPSPKPKTLADGLRSSFAVASMGLNESGHRSRLTKQTAQTASSSPSPRNSISSPPSPPLSSGSSHVASYSHGVHDVSPTPPLNLKFHTFSTTTGCGNRVSALHYLPPGVLLSLQECGILSAISVKNGLCMEKIDLTLGPRFHSPPSSVNFESIINDKSMWVWQTLRVMESPESIIVLVAASNQIPEVDEEEIPRSRVSLFQMQQLPSSFDTTTVLEDLPLLEKVAEWIMPGSPQSISLLSETNTNTTRLFYLNPQSHSTIGFHEIRIVPQAFAVTAPDSLQPSVDAISSTSVVPQSSPSSQPHSLLSIPNPFKSKDNGSSSKREDSNSTPVTSGRVVLGPLIDSGQTPDLNGDQVPCALQVWRSQGDTVEAVVWNRYEIAVFKASLNGNRCTVLARLSMHALQSVERLSEDYLLLTNTKNESSLARLPQELCQRIDIQKLSGTKRRNISVSLISSSLLLGVWNEEISSEPPKQYLAYTTTILKSKQGRNQFQTAWSCHPSLRSKVGDCEISSILPVELEMVIVGLNDGTLRRSSLATLLSSGWKTLESKPASFNAIIVSMYLVQNWRTNERMIISGGDDGSISVWDLPALNLLARWTVFISPLVCVIPLEDERVGRLKGCVLCVSEDGTIAVITVDGLEFLHVIPSSTTRLMRICLGEDNLLLIYSDGSARLWDIRTQEFWRSMTSKIADELLKQGGWFEAAIDPRIVRIPGKPLFTLRNAMSSDAASTLFIDMGELISLINPIPPARLFRDPRIPEIMVSGEEARKAPEKTWSTKKRPRRLRFLKSLVSLLYTFGLDAATDNVCKEILGIGEPKAFMGVVGTGNFTTLSALHSPREVWQISPEHTASRLLALIAALRCLLVFEEECEPFVNTVIAFYVASLPDVVGHSWRSPSLPFLARYWLHPAAEIRLAARAIFGAAAGRLSDEETIHFVEYWQHALPCLQPDSEKQSARAALALLLAGNIATERYTVLSGSTLTDIAKSITLYLHDDGCPHRTLAIDLCSRGFQIWQHHVDAMEVLRSLFTLATSPDKERNVGPQARTAVLQIASSNTPLFMTTLSLDILHPKSMQQRKSTLQLVAYIIRKKPLILYPNLPRLVEAVVKSLDPSSSSDRDAVIDTATEILGQVVKFFPSTDFHMPSQRFCVGTNEGAVVVYDLKTATRLYVLEGHRRRLVACSFSPDGRRLVTVSLEESLVRVWKVGSSITSLFMPGAPPRQGHSGSEPYKTVPFNVGEEANMTPAAVLENVKFEWPAERTARLKIRDNTFTFNT